MSRAGRWMVLAVALAAPLVAASHQGPADLNAVDLNVLVYHPYPDDNGDPWGIPAKDVNGSRADWMKATYGAFFYPTAVFDGVTRIDETTQGEGGGQFQETHATYRGALEERLQRDAPVAIRIEGRVQDQELIVNVTLVSKSDIPTSGLLLRIVLFEDDVTFNGGSGILHHRFVVRDEHQIAGPVVSTSSSSLEHNFSFPRTLEVDHVGVVVVLQNFDEDSPVFAWKEVLQAATWLARQQGPTVQDARGVLLELYSATWCTACVVGDAVADDLANAYGVQSSRVVDTRYEYLRPGEWWKVAIAGMGAVGLVAWLRRQRPPEAPR